MAFFQNIIKAFQNEKNLVSFNGDKEIIASKQPVFPKWFFTAQLGQPRNVNILEVRQFAKSCWVQMVLNTIKKEVTNTEHDIFKKDVNDENDYEDMIKEAKDFLNNINSNNESIDDLNSMVITDVGEIDASTLVEVYSVDSYEEIEVEVTNERGVVCGKETQLALKPFGQRTLVEVKIGDASTFLKQIDVYRNLKNYFQYSFKNPRSNPIKFEKEEVIYNYLNKRSYELYGFSPVQSVQQVVELLIQSTRYNKDFFKNNAIPDGIVSLPNANPDSMKKFKSSWNQQFKGKPHKLLFHNTLADFKPLAGSQRDMEWLDGQKWFHHLVFGVFGVSPVEAGFHENVNQGNQAGQERITVKNAIKPYYRLLEQNVNKILKDYFQMEKLPFEWKYVPKDHVEEQIEFDQNMKELESATMTINEYRRSKGKPPVEWGDEPYNPAASSFNMNFNPGDSFNNDSKDNKEKEDDKKKPGKDDKKDDNDMKDKMLNKKYNEDYEQIAKDSDDYYDFFRKVNKRWEKIVLNAIDKDLDFVKTKSYGDLLKKLMDSINSVPFMRAVGHFVKQGMLSGLEQTEKDLDVQIGFTKRMNDYKKVLTRQQIDGYITNTGKGWYGIKGASKETQLKIMRSIENDISSGATKTEMKDNIKEIFQGSVDSQAERIARTETSRFFNDNKRISALESGLNTKKYIIIINDSVTSDVSKAMNSKYGSKEKAIPMDEEFVVEVNGKQYRGQNPPFMPNDRDSIAFTVV